MSKNSVKIQRPLITSAIFIETSIGSFIVDLYGVDCPAATAEVVNLCRSKYFNGCIATEVVPDNIILFSHPIELLRRETFSSLAGKEPSQSPGTCKQLASPTVTSRKISSTSNNIEELMFKEWDSMRMRTARLREHQGSLSVEYVHHSQMDAAGSIRQRGLLLLEVPQHANGESNNNNNRMSRLVLTLSNRHLEYFENRFMVVGEVREGIRIIEKMRAAPHGRISSASTTSFGVGAASTRPTRLIRIKHTTVLSTPGTEVFADVLNTKSELTSEVKAMSYAFTTAGCFRYWASQAQVQTANRRLISLIQESLTSTSTDASFVLIPEKEENNTVISVEYNPHFHGDFLSSDDDDDIKKNRSVAAVRDAWQQERLNETRALVLGLLDGVPAAADLRPPANVLFVCRLNPRTTAAGLAACFAQCGAVRSVDMPRDVNSDRTLGYAFVEFEDEMACHTARQRMDRALVDDYRIHVDYSQSVSKLWAQQQRESRKRQRD
ncbi:RNA recognition motif domain [Trypanosoma melophagium]|uniref:RNA recognition motif domain n=1 Tax=Trypanosoma melophagium TaxID=715481 RepID=UPI003519E9DB|nr:RNA recognition motif domain [Trypanosoma melophagium]